MTLRKVGWSYNGALFCVDHEPEPSPEDVDFNVPQSVVLDEISYHDVCDVCLIPLNA